MTISKEKFEQMVLEVAKDMLRSEPMEKQYGINRAVTLYFAHALIKRVEAEQEIMTHTKMDIDKPPVYLIALPLVEE